MTLKKLQQIIYKYTYICICGAYDELNTVIGASTLQHVHVGVQREYALESLVNLYDKHVAGRSCCSKLTESTSTSTHQLTFKI